MSLESLLASLETAVAAVADVRANNDGGFRCNGSETADVAAVAAPRTKALPATSATAAKRQTLQENGLQNKPVTAATSATAEKTEVRGCAPVVRLKNSKLDRIAGRRVRIYAIKCEALEC